MHKLFKFIFWNKTLHVSDSSSVHHQKYFTVYTTMVYVIQVTVAACEQDQDGTSSVLTLLASCQQTCYVYSEKLNDDGQRNSRKHVEFYSKNKFEKLVHLVDFIIWIFHDAPSPEHQNPILTLNLLTWKIWWYPNNSSRWQMGFTLAFKGLIK